MDLMREQLDELMGKQRNVPVSDRFKRKEHFSDPDVCKYFLVSFCPHDLFPNTKCDLGRCVKRHDDFYKKMFESDPERAQYEKQYINDMIRLIEDLIASVDVKIKKGRDKFDTVIETDKPKELVERMEQIDEEIKTLLEKVEQLGEEGKIEESEEVTAQVEMLRRKKEELSNLGDASLGIPTKSMKICEICGAMQAISEADRRSQTHLEGKLHTGFALLRKELEILKRKKDELRHEARREVEKKRGDDRPRRSNSRDRRRSNSRDRRRRSGSRDRRRRDDHRRDRRRSRSRDRSRERRDRDRRRREKSRRSRSNSRSSSGNRKKRSSPSPDRKRDK